MKQKYSVSLEFLVNQVERMDEGKPVDVESLRATALVAIAERLEVLIETVQRMAPTGRSAPYEADGDVDEV